jgi:hypothetical protein
MASQIFLSTGYLVPRCLLWIALFLGALVDGLRHVHVKSRGRTLYAGVVLVLFAMVIQDVLLLTYSATDNGTVFSVYIFFTDTADSLFTVRSRTPPPPPLSPRAITPTALHSQQRMMR